MGDSSRIGPHLKRLRSGEDVCEPNGGGSKGSIKAWKTPLFSRYRKTFPDAEGRATELETRPS